MWLWVKASTKWLIFKSNQTVLLCLICSIKITGGWWHLYLGEQARGNDWN
jgi:hypothetical protein